MIASIDSACASMFSTFPPLLVVRHKDPCVVFLGILSSPLGLRTVLLVRNQASLETQLGRRDFHRRKVYNKNGRAPGHLLLPNEFQKRLSSRSLNWPTSCPWVSKDGNQVEAPKFGYKLHLYTEVSQGTKRANFSEILQLKYHFLLC